MSIAEKLVTIANNMPLVFEAGEKKHTSRYATALVVGDGGNIVSFPCSFEPDFISVSYHGADAMASDNSMLLISANKKAFARISGMHREVRSGSMMHGNISATGVATYFRYSNGTCTVEAPASLGAYYTNNTQYVCVAVKYTDKSDRELIEEEIALLSETGATLEYSRTRVLATMTQAEWETLIATKPNRSFTLG